MFRRICFFAGPGAGKSTLAARVFADLKIRGYDVEHIPEFVKTWAYEGRKPESFDQLYLFAQQLHAEDLALRHVHHVVTDSPVLLSPAYAKLYGFVGVEHLIQLAHLFDSQFPSINFFIERTVAYQGKGRYQTFEEALEFDKLLKSFLRANLQRPLMPVRVDAYDDLMKFLVQMLGE
jgi:hypothetical protein